MFEIGEVDDMPDFRAQEDKKDRLLIAVARAAQGAHVGKEDIELICSALLIDPSDLSGVKISMYSTKELAEAMK